MAGVDPVPGSVTTFGARRSTSRDSTIMLRVEVTNGSARSRLQRLLQVADVGRAQVHERVGLAGDRVRADHLGMPPGGHP